METTSAILIKKTRLTESSLIATWMGDASGKLKTVIRSALKTDNRFAGKVDLFFEAEIFFTRAKKGELCHLQDITVKHRYDAARKDYTAMVMCSYFSELVNLTTEMFHPMPAIYDLLKRAIAHLEDQKPTIKALHHFETEMCRHLGVLDSSLPSDSHYRQLLEYTGRALPLRTSLLELLKNPA